MAKLKEQDRRPTYQFKVGDIVRIKPGKTHGPLDNGIILEIQEYKATKHEIMSQSCYVFFAARPVDVWIKAKAYAAAKIILPKEEQDVSHSHIISNAHLIFVNSKPDWLEPPTTQDLRRIRYMKVLDDLPRS